MKTVTDYLWFLYYLYLLISPLVIIYRKDLQYVLKRKIRFSFFSVFVFLLLASMYVMSRGIYLYIMNWLSGLGSDPQDHFILSMAFLASDNLILWLVNKAEDVHELPFIFTSSFINIFQILFVIPTMLVLLFIVLIVTALFF